MANIKIKQFREGIVRKGGINTGHCPDIAPTNKPSPMPGGKTLLGLPLVVVEKRLGGGDIKLGTLDDYLTCGYCGRTYRAVAFAVPSRLPICQHCINMERGRDAR